MISGGETRLALVALAGVLMTAACSTRTTGEPTASVAKPSVAESPAFPSESVPPGVEKDSVLDLNSTKDMTGVVTTVSFADSPYAAHLPDICTLIPNSVTQKLGVDNKDRGFDGTQLISQACSMQHIESGHVAFSVTVNFFTSNITNVSTANKTLTISANVPISNRVTGTTIKLRPSDADDLTFREECGTAWGTFFGAIVVNYRTKTPQTGDPCQRSIVSAQILAPYMPKSPSQMRPAP